MNSGRLSLCTILVLLLSFQGLAQYNPVIGDFASDTVFRHASVSITVRDAVTGEIVESLNENMAVGSASVMKLVTTSAALEILGPDFTFMTRIGYTGTIDRSGTLKGNIIIKGGGDPALASERFEDHYGDIFGNWSTAIRSLGIKRIDGRIISDATIFNYSPAPGGWSWADLGNYYGAGAYGLSVFDNMYRINFITAEDGTRPLLTGISPDIPGLLIDNQLIARGDTDNGYVYIEPYGNRAVIKGNIPVNRDDFVLKASIPDPPGLASIMLESRLKEDGIKVDYPATSLRLFNPAAEGTEQNSAVVVYTTISPVLSDIVRVTNVESVNLFAEHLLKMISLTADSVKPAGSDAGIELVFKFLDEKGIGHGGLYMADGSGLSRYNAISSSFITALLNYMKNRSEYGGYFTESLPAAGEEGTLKYFFRDPVFAGRLVAKSGTSTRIRNYAGYIRSSGGKEYSFAVLVNNFDCSTTAVTQRVEKLLKELIERN